MKKGKTITNKITGEKITWIETSADTNGKHISFDFEVAPKGNVIKLKELIIYRPRYHNPKGCKRSNFKCALIPFRE